ncbi:cytochrome o ubiquinol oxidase subunit IV [Coxiella endosymbiont of Amblyomma americanum]|uniref:cytochrome o ubiquinol oxidase subunit IV n=1 Tax=Coxiella endosymbiont of Amblyomma americanum TaxID=325775 RepID=UPI000581E5D5|nr:cytochrome o ubiquinol oxidase subunit IV [Coxiella endosymbiont of Amblyomma americanum]AJC50604.1 cytochrome O ubiquinol oxidase [Coxiella endosymbiont of Amblyomma americanum]AUJ58934.1 cytochrome o ubiquinol oxidase subunit IV [Coxiella-like endosymbiont of Amblyomma americanum]
MNNISFEKISSTGEKKLGVYVLGIILCIALTFVSFLIVIMNTSFSKIAMLNVVFISAFVQFIVQIVFFLQLNTKNEHSKVNLISFVFTMVILIVLIGGSLWILWSLHYRMIR